MEHIIASFVHLANPTVFLFLLAGVAVGLTVGSIPGLNDSITLAVLIPVTFSMHPDYAFPLLVGIYCAACYGGSIPAILLRIPGTASSVVTALDGYAMAQKGEAGQALGISTTSSVFGGITSSIILLFFAPILASYALRFGPPEYFALALMGLSTVAGMSGGNMVKSLIVCLIGLLISTVGISPLTGYPRFTFDSPNLYDGIPFIPMLIGLFGVTSVLELAESICEQRLRSRAGEDVEIKIPRIGRVLPKWSMVKRLLPTWMISSGIGNVIGIIPGAGMLMAIYMAYDQTARRHKDKDFGSGVPEGVAAPEAANNAVVASSMVPLLSLGVPGNSTSALFLGALLIQGLRPGPALFRDTPDIAYLIVVSFLVANIVMAPMGIFLGRTLSRLIFKLPREVLGAVISVLCLTGAFAVGNSVFNIWVAIGFGVLGYVFNKCDLPHSPLILAVVLGAMMERGLFQSLTLSHGSLSIFVTRPISLVLLIGALFFVATPLIKSVYRRRKNGKNGKNGEGAQHA
ncbi:tripartite tricarboxylate transporter permease [Oceanidesulfovibrio marinus]|uniref:C4-dicarboxylate ABC transporter n=1 Tax=Oceanidesulfovibrio marinus TaxID=370038 RepID=A0A6P1ZQR8_9BACT|nr:tripartite tricarboxylate transporter permease [Oceanidesulfovibrio marinus]QJT08747.1 C4-dicarboxylate ABC transporter [Oceanidesulfovibrio marinus]TVM36825.1 C4-dicarboxylate ABC transporter [Oceanidesulfovibrio marinus]